MMPRFFVTPAKWRSRAPLWALDLLVSVSFQLGAPRKCSEPLDLMYFPGGHRKKTGFRGLKTRNLPIICKTGSTIYTKCIKKLIQYLTFGKIEIVIIWILVYSTHLLNLYLIIHLSPSYVFSRYIQWNVCIWTLSLPFSSSAKSRTTTKTNRHRNYQQTSSYIILSNKSSILPNTIAKHHILSYITVIIINPRHIIIIIIIIVIVIVIINHHHKSLTASFSNLSMFSIVPSISICSWVCLFPPSPPMWGMVEVGHVLKKNSIMIHDERPFK